jgi:hypothetical protein
MLGLGLGLNKNTAFKKYALDYIPGAYESCVAFFSYYQPSAKYKDELCRIKRLDTGTEKDIGPVNGYIEDSAVSTFCAGTTGLVTTIYNSSNAAGKQDAIQTTPANMPIIYESGSFLQDGFKFVAANSKYMSIVDYASLNITEPILSIYTNHRSDLDTGYIYIRGNNNQYGIRAYYSCIQNKIVSYLNDVAISTNTTEISKSIFIWKDKNVNGRINKTASEELLNQYALSLNNDTSFNTIGSKNTIGFLTGNIKTLAIFNSNQYDNYLQLAALV